MPDMSYVSYGGPRTLAAMAMQWLRLEVGVQGSDCNGNAMAQTAMYSIPSCMLLKVGGEVPAGLLSVSAPHPASRAWPSACSHHVLDPLWREDLEISPCGSKLEAENPQPTTYNAHLMCASPLACACRYQKFE